VTSIDAAAEQRDLVTESGTRIVAVSIDAAAGFLDRVGARRPDEIWVALAAVQDAETMVGVAVLGATPADLSRITVAVVPERRRLHIGTDLLHALVAEAARSDCQYLRISYPADDTAADVFLQSSGLVAARQALNGVVTVVLAA
jgi:ribosomal protein S18 acetylase RimI-like enzyme